MRIDLKTIAPQPAVSICAVRLAIGIASEHLTITDISLPPELQNWELTSYQLLPVNHPDYDNVLLLRADCSTDGSEWVTVDSLELWTLSLDIVDPPPPVSVLEVPFMFSSCSDNVVFTSSRDTALMPLQILTSAGLDISDFSAPMPTTTGPADSCYQDAIEGVAHPVAAIVYRSGRVSIPNGDSDLVGDLNLDGSTCQTSDLDLFGRFFRYGDSVFTIDIDRQIAVSDLNDDHIDTTLTDLVALRYCTLNIPLPEPGPPVFYHGQFRYVLVEPGQMDISLCSDCPVGAYNLWLSTLGTIVDSVVFLHDHDPGQLGCHIAEWHAARLRILGLGGRADNPWIDDSNTDLARVYYQGMNPQPIIERLAAADLSTMLIGEFTDTPPEAPPLPTRPHLSANYPNPFNPATRIDFYLPRRTPWQLTIIDITGRTIRTFKGGPALGRMSVEWDGRTDGGEAVASGVYLYRLRAADWSDSRKMILLK